MKPFFSLQPTPGPDQEQTGLIVSIILNVLLLTAAVTFCGLWRVSVRRGRSGVFIYLIIFFFFFGFWFDSQFKNHQCGVTCMNFHIHTVIRWFDLFSVRHAASHRSYNSASCWLLISHHLLHLQSKRCVFKKCDHLLFTSVRFLFPSMIYFENIHFTI